MSDCKIKSWKICCWWTGTEHKIVNIENSRARSIQSEIATTRPYIMHPFQRRRDLTFITFSLVCVPDLEYSPNSFILVSRGFTQSAIVVSSGSVLLFLPSSILDTCGSTVDTALCLLMKNTSGIFVFIFQARSRCLQRFYIDQTKVLFKNSELPFCRNHHATLPNKK